MHTPQQTYTSSSSPSNLHSFLASSLSPPGSGNQVTFNLYTSTSMALNSTEEGCDSFSAVDLPEEDNNVPHCEPPVALPNSLEVVYVPLASQLPMVDQMRSQTYIMKMQESAHDCSKCSEKYVDIEKGKSGTTGISGETVGNLKNEQVQMKSLQKQISFEMGGKYLQFLMNHSLILPKFSARGEKVVEAPRMRKYKRTTSFNSRKVALMFSVLSSLGTIILIYLTLRVKQMSAASIHSE